MLNNFVYNYITVDASSPRGLMSELNTLSTPSAVKISCAEWRRMRRRRQLPRLKESRLTASEFPNNPVPVTLFAQNSTNPFS